jgi:hypothetical protein
MKRKRRTMSIKRGNVEDIEESKVPLALEGKR